MRNKKLTNRKKKRHYTRMAVLLSLISPWKTKEKKRKKKYYNTGYSYLATHPSTIAAEQDLTLLSRRNMLLSLWYSDSTVKAFFKFLISLYFPSHAVSHISFFDTFSHFRNLRKMRSPGSHYTRRTATCFTCSIKISPVRRR